MPARAWPIAREGFPFIVSGAAVAGFGWAVAAAPLAVVGSAWAVACAFFFRNPSRAVPAIIGGVVAPADGTVIGCSEVMEPYFLNRPMRKLSIFLSVLNVHINRVPIGGRVVGTRYIPGRFRIASHRNASEENERNAIWLQGDGGEEVVMVQVAGLIARRIVSYVREGDKVDRGERCGLIRFGSRVDLYLPLSWPIAVQVGARVRGGASLVARIGDHQ